MTTLLIDGDIVAFRAACAFETLYQWDEDTLSVATDRESAQQLMETTIGEWGSKLKATNIVIALSSYRNFRKEINPNYKANRVNVRRPEMLADLRAWLIDEYRTEIWDTLEADDVLGILSTGKQIKGRKVIVSIDKDFLTVPGLWFNPGRTRKTPRRITKKEADYYFMRQVLMGDPVDGYYGIKGVGVKKAEKLLKDAPEDTLEGLWNVVLEAYLAKGLTEKEAVMNARMARILRAEDYDSTKGKIKKLWTPNQ